VNRWQLAGWGVELAQDSCLFVTCGGAWFVGCEASARSLAAARKRLVATGVSCVVLQTLDAHYRCWCERAVYRETGFLRLTAMEASL